MTAKLCGEALLRLRERAPLVHSMSNLMSMHLTANALLALGASPCIPHASEEIEHMVSNSGSLVVNIGSLSGEWIECLIIAMNKARALGKPIIFDPLGAGITPFRTATARRLLGIAPPTVIRGNAAEILALAQQASDTALGTPRTALEAARALALEFDCTVSLCRPADYVILSDSQTAKVLHGHPLLSKVMGLSCTSTALIGAFAAVSSNSIIASTSGLACLGLAGDRAASRASGPGTFMPFFLDELAQLTPEDLRLHAKIE